MVVDVFDAAYNTAISFLKLYFDDDIDDDLSLVVDIIK